MYRGYELDEGKIAGYECGVESLNCTEEGVEREVYDDSEGDEMDRSKRISLQGPSQTNQAALGSAFSWDTRNGIA